MIRHFFTLFIFALLSAAPVSAASQVASVKLKVELAMGETKKAVETFILPSGEWVNKAVGAYSFKAKATPQEKEAVKVEMEMKASGNDDIKKSAIITKWESEPATVESKDDSGRLIYRVSVVASKKVH